EGEAGDRRARLLAARLHDRRQLVLAGLELRDVEEHDERALHRLYPFAPRLALQHARRADGHLAVEQQRHRAWPEPLSHDLDAPRASEPTRRHLQPWSALVSCSPGPLDGRHRVSPFRACLIKKSSKKERNTTEEKNQPSVRAGAAAQVS